MRVETLSITRNRDDGARYILIGFNLESNEPLEATDIAVIEGYAAELQDRLNGGSRDPEVASEPSPAPAQTSRRRGQSAASPIAASAEPPTPPETASGRTAATAAPSSGRRRGQSAANPTSASAPTTISPAPAASVEPQTAGAASPSNGRRRAAPLPDTTAGPSAQPTEPTSAAPASGRRRGSANTPAAKPAEFDPMAQVSEADMVKLASAAGRVLSPAGVIKYLKESFGVNQVQEVKAPEDRARFIAGLRNLMAQAGAA